VTGVGGQQQKLPDNAALNFWECFARSILLRESQPICAAGLISPVRCHPYSAFRNVCLMLFILMPNNSGISPCMAGRCGWREHPISACGAVPSVAAGGVIVRSLLRRVQCPPRPQMPHTLEPSALIVPRFSPAKIPISAFACFRAVDAVLLDFFSVAEATQIAGPGIAPRRAGPMKSITDKACMTNVSPRSGLARRAATIYDGTSSLRDPPQHAMAAVVVFIRQATLPGISPADIVPK